MFRAKAMMYYRVINGKHTCPYMGEPERVTGQFSSIFALKLGMLVLQKFVMSEGIW